MISEDKNGKINTNMETKPHIKPKMRQQTLDILSLMKEISNISSYYMMAEDDFLCCKGNYIFSLKGILAYILSYKGNLFTFLLFFFLKRKSNIAKEQSKFYFISFKK